MTRLVISAAVDPGPAHDRIRVWVRGQNVGALTVGAGDGEAVASRLVRLGLEQGERIESESGSVHFSEPADSEALCPACGAVPGACSPTCSRHHDCDNRGAACPRCRLYGAPP